MESEPSDLPGLLADIDKLPITTMAELHTQIGAYREENSQLVQTLEAMRRRDNENGSLPPAYRAMIDAVLEHDSHQQSTKEK